MKEWQLCSRCGHGENASARDARWCSETCAAQQVECSACRAATLSLSVELGCNEHQQPAVWLVAVAHEARWSRAETPRTRAAVASGQQNVQAVLQQTCKPATSKRASKLPAAASGSRAAAATVDKPRQQNRADLAFGPEVNGFTSLRSQIPGFVVDGPI